MMLSPVSSVRFCAAEAPKVNFDREGAYSRINTPAVEPEKKSGGKKLLKTILGLAVAAAVIAVLPKVFKNSIKVLDKAELADAKFLQKAGHHLATAGEWICDHSYRPIVKLFKGKGAETVADAAKDVVA